MKPLSIEEIKKLEKSTIYIIDIKNDLFTSYHKIFHIDNEEITTKSIFNMENECYEIEIIFEFSNYGKTWLAYKNKEQAQQKLKELRGEK